MISFALNIDMLKNLEADLERFLKNQSIANPNQKVFHTEYDMNIIRDELTHQFSKNKIIIQSCDLFNRLDYQCNNLTPSVEFGFKNELGDYSGINSAIKEGVRVHFFFFKA